MAKDPAFLFYSKDFYEGTRDMFPEERACYIDLLCYQHQKGPIPSNTQRLVQYCSGIDKATLEATLKAKFILTNEGWVNEKLLEVAEKRKDFKEGQSDHALVGVFFKKAKRNLKAKDLKELKDYIYNDFGKENLVELIKENNRDYELTLDITLKDTLEGSLNHLENGNGNENENENENKDLKEGKSVKVRKVEAKVNYPSYFHEGLQSSDYLKSMHSSKRTVFRKQIDFASEISIPFDSPEFRKAFLDFLEHKVMISSGYKTAKGMQALFEVHSHHTEQELIVAFKKAVASGTHKTIYPEKIKSNGKDVSRQAAEYLSANDTEYQSL